MLPFQDVSGSIPKNKGLWSPDSFKLLKDDIVQLLTLIRWSVTNSYYNIALVLFSNPDSQTLNKFLTCLKSSIYLSCSLGH